VAAHTQIAGCGVHGHSGSRHRLRPGHARRQRGHPYSSGCCSPSFPSGDGVPGRPTSVPSDDGVPGRPTSVHSSDDEVRLEHLLSSPLEGPAPKEGSVKEGPAQLEVP